MRRKKNPPIPPLSKGGEGGLRDLGEFGLIKRISKRSRIRDSSVMVGIGDDAAVITPPSPPLNKGGMGGVAPLLITTDSLVEDVHFRRDSPPEALGWKALAVNISDIAAMGGMPKHYLLSLSVPEGISVDYLDRLFAGMTDAARRHGLSLIGGDTTSSPDRIYISVTVIGEASKNILLRKGAKAGDQIFVTGTLGDSALGLRMLEESGVGSWELGVKDLKLKTIINRHLRPVPRVKEGILLANSGTITSMIDISDGLLADLGHICEESKVGATVWADKIPLSKGFKSLSDRFGGIDLALSGGEDYELLFTVNGKEVKNFLSEAKGVKSTHIGEITKGKGVRVVGKDGQLHIPQRSGYEHFKG
ncbi:MAG: thiamine-phosphate kinase [Deltaproteobacteria bacterium]|nr:thiamine-phosphate kinase [Deltaproteobacteria bacterium]